MTEVLAGTVAETARLGERVLAEVEQVIVGKPEAVKMVLLGVLASGHILIEDLPGLGKTLLARTFATVLGLEFTRVQFTPDLLPADLTGATVLDRAPAIRCSGPARYSPGCCWPTRSTGPRPRPRRPCSRRWPKARSAPTGVTRRCPAVRGDRHRQPDRVRGHLPAAGGPARPVHRPRPARLPRRRGRGRDGPPPAGPRLGSARPVAGHRPSRAAGHAGIAGERAAAPGPAAATWSPWSPPPAPTRRSRWAPRRAARWR